MAKKSATSLQTRGAAALAAYDSNRALIEPRLPAGFRDAFVTSLSAIGVVVPSVRTAREGAKGATLSEAEAAASLKNRVLAMRELVSAERSIGAASRKAWGTGIKMSPRVNRSIVAAARAIIAQAAAAPAEKAAAGILDADVEALSAGVRQLDGADAAQGTQKRRSKSATAIRNSTLKAVDGGIAKIRAAGMAAAVGGHDGLYQEFAAL